MKLTSRADDEAKLAYALTVGMSFDDGLKMVREMFKVDDLDACELIARGSLLAKRAGSAA